MNDSLIRNRSLPSRTTSAWRARLGRGVARVSLASLVLLGSAGFSHNAEARGYHGHGHGYYGSYRHHRGHHGHHRSDRGAYLAGGLILGSLITHAWHRNHQPYHEPYVVRRTRVIREEPVIVSSSVSRRLFRDRDGNCFERTYNRDGDELMLELDPAECAW